MDRFELNWPGADASFYTDGSRCRIIWRQRGRRGGGGMGGTIDNNQQCVKRAAESLEGTPYLLSALKARGHARLADQIETAAGDAPVAVAESTVGRTPARADRHERRKDAENRPAPKRVQQAEEVQAEKVQAEVPAAKPAPVAASKTPAAKVADEKAWLNNLQGDGAYEAATNKRAKAWLDLGIIGDEALLLKTPAGKTTEWVLKRTWPEDAKRKAEYVIAGAFKGIATFLVDSGAKTRDIEQALAALADAADAELVAAAKAWRAAGHTH